MHREKERGDTEIYSNDIIRIEMNREFPSFLRIKPLYYIWGEGISLGEDDDVFMYVEPFFRSFSIASSLASMWVINPQSYDLQIDGFYLEVNYKQSFCQIPLTTIPNDCDSEKNIYIDPFLNDWEAAINNSSYILKGKSKIEFFIRDAHTTDSIWFLGNEKRSEYIALFMNAYNAIELNEYVEFDIRISCKDYNGDYHHSNYSKVKVSFAEN